MKLGAGPNDLVAVILSDAAKKPFGIVRILVDGMWTVVGVLLGGSIGIGSLLAVVLVGASMQIYIKIKLFSKYVISAAGNDRR